MTWEEREEYGKRLSYSLVSGLGENPQDGFGVEDISSIEAEWTDGSDEPNFAWLLRLNDGRFVAATGWHDYTGWDCQSGLTTSIHATRDEAIRFGLTLNDREVLGLSLPEEVIL